MKNHAFNQNAYINAYSKEHYDRVTILLPKGDKEKLKEVAKSNNMTVTQYLLMARDFYERNKEESI